MLSTILLIGIPLFFFVSGYALLASNLHITSTLKSILRSFLKRVLRIQLPLAANIFLAWGILLFLNHFFVWKLEPNLFNFERFLANLFVYVQFTDQNWFNVVYWTLTIEIQFYIVFFLVFYFIRKNHYLLISFILLFSLSSFFTDVRFIFHYAPLFSIGMLLAARKNERVSIVEFWIGFLFTLFCGIINNEIHWIISVCFAALLCLFVNFKSKILNFFGEISFSLYLTHGNSAILFLTIASFSSASSWSAKAFFLIIAFIISIAGAFVFYRIIEKQTLKLIQKIFSS